MEVKRLKCSTLVVGSGAAGYAAAVDLCERGVRDVLLISEAEKAGTSRNAGSDKQTYYKLSIGGSEPDSVLQMAEDLFHGGSVDGDNALCEAANSVRCFMRLLELGVGFPSDPCGVFVGYKTDHDKRGRATSAGPLTSRTMTDELERRAVSLGVKRLFGLKAIEVLTSHGRAVGILASGGGEIYSIRAENLIMATGGPAAIYSHSVYPESQNGATGMLIRAGAVAQNLTEWQFGLASTNPRWNVSGTYMQVLPSFVSVDNDGVERRFLECAFADASDCLDRVFLKGYEWPFDSRKLQGSSVIDLLVHAECAKGRKVYLDYTENPFGNIDFTSLSPDAYTYLSRAGACFGKPIDRLKHMNMPAYEFYLSKGVDLAEGRLEISLCAQHCNGGISVDADWQSSVEGLFVVGEAAGTHGIYRPGGSALNAGQVGAMRAAEFISRHTAKDTADDEFDAAEQRAVLAVRDLITAPAVGSQSAIELHNALAEEMSLVAGALRSFDGIECAVKRREELLANLSAFVAPSDSKAFGDLFLLRDSLYASLAVLYAMKDFYITSNGATRGSALYINPKGDNSPFGMDELRYRKSTDLSSMIQEIAVTPDGRFEAKMRCVRPIPKIDECFENVWKKYREK